MGVRKNAKFLSATERENFVKACVLMKADIVNPGAPVANQYSRWDEFVAIHSMIQDAFAPGAAHVNFGHGGAGAFSFLSWHRYFIYRLEQQLQTYVPGVMLPYWDWTDPAPLMTETFLGPNTAGSVVSIGYFAFDKPGSGANTTTPPAWWPATLNGWRLPSAFGPPWAGGLVRNQSTVASLPTTAELQTTLTQLNYSSFQSALEGGFHMHNYMHGWLGAHAGNVNVSCFDPIFYLHHANVDRLWAMWQLDGHADEYPTMGGSLYHHRNDLMYPWVGAAAGYGTNKPISAAIPMPNFAPLGGQRNVDTLNFREAFNYTYDTLPIIGIALDRTGSMTQLTPDPMTTGAPDVTKWEAAKRGVAAFLQDCETVQASRVTYVHAGVKTFRSLATNDFASVFPAPGYGLVKTGGSVSKAAFESAVAALSPGGATPLADALLDTRTTMVLAPFAGKPTDERRYLAMLTDGMLTSGAPMSSIPNGSLTRTAIFAMGFGTAADVDYGTLANIAAKGLTLSTPQVFHGENAGVIDKFYSNSLAKAIGFTTIFDPVVELFAEEHAHIHFVVNSADDVVLVTAQGMDFTDDNWNFMLHGPGDMVLYTDISNHHQHQSSHAGCNHCCPTPSVTARREDGRLTLVLERSNAEAQCWVGTWHLMVGYKMRRSTAMVMPDLGEWLFPVAAGPVRGPRYSRLLVAPKNRTAKRNIVRPSRHLLDRVADGTNRSDRDACDLVVNIYTRSTLQLELTGNSNLAKIGEALKFELAINFPGAIRVDQIFARLIAPAKDLASIVRNTPAADIPKDSALTDSIAFRHDTAKILAKLEGSDPSIAEVRDIAVEMVRHHDGPWHTHFNDTQIPGVYHLGLYVEGSYNPDPTASDNASGGHHHPASHAPGQAGPGIKEERFSRLLNASIGVVA